MKLSTKSRYALEGLLYLAVYSQGRPLSVKEIAEGTNISTAYMEQIFFNMRKAGLVSTVRGAKGGFMLGHQEKDITVGMIIRAIEGSMVPVKCVASLSDCSSHMRSGCLSRRVWVRISNAISESADRLTLEDLKNKFIAENGGVENENFDQGQVWPARTD